jgi:hypothetical protein
VVYVCMYVCMYYVCVYTEEVHIYNIILDRLKIENYIEAPIMKFPLEVTNVIT